MFVDARVDDLVDYISLAAKDSRTILDMELQVLEMNGFNLLVYHPYRPLKGFIQYIKEEIRPDAKHLKLLKSSAQEFVDESLFSDAMLCYSPAQIALACLIRACRNDSATMHLEKEIWNLDALLKESNSLETLKKVVEEILSIQEKQISSSETEQIQELNRLLEKWNKCHNLLNDPRSRIYHKQKIEKEEEEDQKKLEKQKASRLLRERKVHDLLNK